MRIRTIQGVLRYDTEELARAAGTLAAYEVPVLDGTRYTAVFRDLTLYYCGGVPAGSRWISCMDTTWLCISIQGLKDGSCHSLRGLLARDAAHAAEIWLLHKAFCNQQVSP